MSTGSTESIRRKVPRQRAYLYPPVSHAPRIQELFDDFERLGHHPFPLPLGILLDEEDGKAFTPVPVCDAPRSTAFLAWSTARRTLR